MQGTHVTRVAKPLSFRNANVVVPANRTKVGRLQIRAYAQSQSTTPRAQADKEPNLRGALLQIANDTVDAAAKRENMSGWRLSHSRGLKEEQDLRNAVMGRPRGQWTNDTEPTDKLSRASRTLVPRLESVPLYLPNQSVGDVRAGYLAEAHRNSTDSYGVVIGFEQRRRELNVILLGADGLLHILRTSDLTFAYAGFVSDEVVAQTGLGDSPENEMQAAARIRIVKRLREIESAVEHASATVLRKSASLYAKFRDPNEEKWGIMTMEDALAHVFGPKTTIRVHHVLALRGHLLKNPNHFLIDTVDMINSRSYYVRPVADVQNFEQVQEWIRNNDRSIRSFVEKARVLIQRSRSLRAEWVSLETMPLDVEDSLAFTDADKQIIKFFQNSTRRQRFIQADPWAPIVPTIIKRIGLYEGSVDQGMIFLMLQELGVHAPWDTLIAHGPDGTEMNLRGVPLGEPGTSLNERAAEARSQELLGMSEPVQTTGKFQLCDGLDSIRRDFGDLPVYTIDDYDAQEIDDGLSIESVPGTAERYWVHMHIADPSSIIHPLDDIVRPIEQAGISTYFVGRTWPMIPSSLTNRRFSLGQLKEGSQPQPVLTFSALVGMNGEILDYRVTPGWIRNVIVNRYDDVDTLLGAQQIGRHYPLTPHPPDAPQSTIDPRHKDDLSKLATIADKLKRRRFRHPVIYFGSTSIDIKLASNEKLPIVPPINELTRPQLFRGYPDVRYGVLAWSPGMVSRGVVGELMLAAGIVGARFAQEHKLPFIYRISERHTGTEQDDADLVALRDPRDLSVPVSEVFKRHIIFGTAMYTPDPGPHTAIGVMDGNAYSRVTSPLRRFTDLVNHWQIKAALRRTLPSQLLDASTLPGGKRHMQPLSRDTMMRIGKEHDVVERASRRAAQAETHSWAMRALARALVDPSMSYARDTLSDLEAIVMSDPTWDIERRELYVDAYVPKLGLAGSVYPYRSQGGIGDVVRVRLELEHSIFLYAVPKIRFKLRDA